jgi:hypothetical protein
MAVEYRTTMSLADLNELTAPAWSRRITKYCNLSPRRRPAPGAESHPNAAAS